MGRQVFAQRRGAAVLASDGQQQKWDAGTPAGSLQVRKQCDSAQRCTKRRGNSRGACKPAYGLQGGRPSGRASRDTWPARGPCPMSQTPALLHYIVSATCKSQGLRKQELLHRKVGQLMYSWRAGEPGLPRRPAPSSHITCKEDAPGIAANLGGPLRLTA